MTAFFESFKIILSLVFMLNFLTNAHGYKNNIPRDTTYTSKSALLKVSKEYPHAKLVKQFEGLNIIEKKNLVYAEYDNRKLMLDLISPSKYQNEKLPLVILIHGGGWVSGDRSMLIPLAQQIAEDGFISAAIEYRLSPDSKYPAALNDILTSIKWLKYHSAQYNIDTVKITLLGTSAGGHLAALAAITWDSDFYILPDSLDHISAKVNAVIDIDGVLDLTHPAESSKDTNEVKPSVLKRWLGFTFSENPELWKQASPVNHIGINTPPILFVNSSIPRFHAGRDEMIEEMNQNNIYSEVHTLDDSPHSFWLLDPWFETTKNYVLTFLNRIFKNSTSSEDHNER